MPKTTKTHKSNPEKTYHWIVSPDAYLATALSVCEAISAPGFPDQVLTGNDFIKNLGFRSAHPNYELIFPIIYNLKHGIELYLKGLGCADHQTYITVHDLKELFDFAITNAKSLKKQQILQKMKDETWSTIKKYYYGTYNPSIKAEGTPDKMNDAERYPESTAYKIPDPYKWVTGNVIESIKQDILFLESKFAQAKRDIVNN